MKRIAIYSRKSKETDTGESIQTQIDLCKFYFDRQHENCTYEIFQDEGFSGGNTNRPAFQRMMQLATHKQFDIVAVYKVDRIARNIVDFMTTFNELETNNVSLVSITEGFDASTPGGKMMMTMLAGFAEMERMNIAQRVKDNMQALAKLGRWSGGTPPTGYESEIIINDNGKKECYLKLISEKIPLIKSIFKMAADGYNNFQISKELNLPTKTVYNIITNPTYAPATEEVSNYLTNEGYEVIGELNGNGLLSYNRRPRRNGKKLTRGNNMLAVVSKHETPITSSEWIQANINVKARGSEPRPRISQYTWLAQLVVCKCGSTMQVIPGHYRKDGSRLYYLFCKEQKQTKQCNAKRVRVDKLEKDVLDELIKLSLNKKLLDETLNKKYDFTQINNSIKMIKKDISAIQIKINSLTEKLANIEGAAFDIIVDKINLLAEDNKKNNEKLLLLEREKILNTKSKVNVDAYQIYLKGILENFELLPIEEKQIFISNIIDYIQMIDSTNFTIVYK